MTENTSICPCLLAYMASLVQVDPTPYRYGRWHRCAEHAQMIIGNGKSWLWSGRAEDLEALPPMADTDTLLVLAD